MGRTDLMVRSASMGGRCSFVSFRLGGTDGVSIVADRWMEVMSGMGWTTSSVAGAGPVDRLIPGLDIGSPMPPDPLVFAAAIDDADLVVVENLLTIPMHLEASRVVADALRGRPALLHHHDPPWQRDRYADITELPADDPAWVHVTINQRTRAEFAERGIEATTIYNGFEIPTDAGNRDEVRRRLGVGADEPLVVHPVRAIARKNIPAALWLAEELGATYWLTGAAEEDYAPELARSLASARTRVIHRSWDDTDDLYAASDLVVFPSTWEGFGNPPVEAAIRNRPVIVGDYPIAAEQRALGFDWPRFDWPGTELVEFARSELRSPDPIRLATNRRVAVTELGLEKLATRLQYVLDQAGWHP
jgi:glycosyltransferase involved in cell wall biosynthesis